MPDKRQVAFEIIQDLLVSLTLTVTALWVSKAGATPLVILKETCFAWIVNMIIGFTVPEKKMGEYLAGKMGLKNLPAFLLTMFVIVLINVAGISLCVVWKNVGFNRQFAVVWTGLFPVLLGVGYAAALLWFPVTSRIAGVICGKR